jgi:hypothetical protein
MKYVLTLFFKNFNRSDIYTELTVYWLIGSHRTWQKKKKIQSLCIHTFHSTELRSLINSPLRISLIYILSQFH